MKILVPVSLLLFLFLCSCAGCDLNRMTLVGGTVKLVTYSATEDGGIEIRDFSEGDSILGISIVFDAIAYKDDIRYDYDNPNSHGPKDSITSMAVFLYQNDSLVNVTESLVNDTSLNKMRFHPKYYRDIHSRTCYDGCDMENPYYQSIVFNDINDFVSQYNDRSMFDGSIGCFQAQGMEEELFFWINDPKIIELAQSKEAVAIVLNLKGRVLVLKGER